MPGYFKIGTFGISQGGGTYAVTGVGFKPTAVILIDFGRTTPIETDFSVSLWQSWGWSDGVSQQAFGGPGRTQNFSNQYQYSDDTKCIYIPDESGDSYTLGSISSLDEDGFTIVITNGDRTSFTSTVHYIAIGGVSAKILSDTHKTVIGNSAKTGVGFRPKLAFFMGQFGEWNTGYTSSGQIFLGATDGTNQFVLAGNSVAVNRNKGYSVKTKCVANITSVVDGEAEIVSLDADGYTLNTTKASAAERPFGVLCLGGAGLEGVSIIEYVAPSTATAQAYTGVGFQPTGVLCVSDGKVGSAVLTPDSSFGIGAYGMDTVQGGRMFAIRDGDNLTAQNQFSITSAIMGPGALQSGDKIKASITSLDADGFTTLFSLVGSGVRTFYGIALRIVEVKEADGGALFMAGD